MDTYKLILTLLTIAALLLVPSVGSADTFNFDVTSGIWGDAGNWLEPGGPPKAGDRAIIDTGQTCRIEAPQAAWVVVLRGTGTAKLIIKGETLTMLPKLGASGAMILDGIVKFEKPGGTTPKIAFTTGANEPFFISTHSGAEIVADGASGHEGVIEGATILAVLSGITVKGSIAVDCTILDNEGLFLVDAAADTMYIGTTAVGVLGTSGSGTFEVTAGDMFIRRLKPTANFDGTLKVSGGTMTLTEHVAFAISTDASVEVSGGTLLFEIDWESFGGLDFSGGTIKVVEDETATFDLP